MIGLRLADVGASIALYTNVATLTGAGGASVAAWASGGFYPPRAALLWTNTGAAAVTIGSAEVPAQLLVAGNVVGVALFGGRQVEISAGDSVWCPLPEGVAALGAAWSVSAPMTSGATVSVSIVARYLATSAATASETADAVCDEALAGHTTAGTVGAALGATLPAYFLDDTVERNSAGLPTSARRRFYASAAHLAAATAGGALTGNEVATQTITWTYSGRLLTAQRGAA